ncbi:MAG: hypothetical protein AMXMBFR81_15640 [Chthonomonas sp.]
MKMLSRFLPIAVLAVAAMSAMAQSPAGKWTGKLDISKADMMKSAPKDMPADQRKQMEAMMDSMLVSLKKMTFSMTVNANNTWKMVVKGAPGAAGPNGKPQPDSTAEGKWTQKGDKVTFEQTKENGKAKPKDAHSTKSMTLSKDGKTMTMVENQGGQTIKIVFKKA